jgi:hypothetical protein
MAVAQDPGWFSYPIGHLTLRARPEPGADEVVVEVHVAHLV